MRIMIDELPVQRYSIFPSADGGGYFIHFEEYLSANRLADMEAPGWFRYWSDHRHKGEVYRQVNSHDKHAYFIRRPHEIISVVSCTDRETTLKIMKAYFSGKSKTLRID